MSDEKKEMLQKLEEIIDNFPMPKDVFNVLRKLIELRVVGEIAEAFRARENEIAIELVESFEKLENEYGREEKW